jgi:hypothetical protein
MRFRYIDFTEIFVTRERAGTVTLARICVALAALLLWSCPLTARAQARRINGYAVQVAALTSRGSADALARGLSARGMNAYLVGGASYSAAGSAALYRVRIGNFQTIASAKSYAEKNLLSAGLISAYAITAYDAPSKGDSIAGLNWKIPTFTQKRPQKYPGRQFETDLIDVVATIGSRGWLLLSSESINLTVRTGNSAISRELVALVDAIGSRGWGLTDNVTKFLGAPAPIKIVSLPSDILTNGAGAPPAVTATGSYTAAAPEIGRAEIGRGGLGPTTSTSMRPGSSGPRGYGPPPRLQGALEMRGGRVWMTLRNIDTDRVFSGVARISLTDDQNQEDVTPVNVTLLPDKETSFPLDGATLTNGAWILMVYDLNGVARMIRGASFAPPKRAAQTPEPSDSTEPGLAPDAPPSYVTGVYDATGWTQPQVSPQVESQAATTAPTTAQDDTSVVEGASAALNPPQQATNDQGAVNDPGAVTASLRQIAVTSENVTLELAISAQNPLKNVTVVLRAGDFQDVRQAFIPNTQGRVPFLVPAKFASTGLYYEVKDEAQRLLTSGSASLSNLSK